MCWCTEDRQTKLVITWSRDSAPWRQSWQRLWILPSLHFQSCLCHNHLGTETLDLLLMQKEKSNCVKCTSKPGHCGAFAFAFNVGQNIHFHTAFFWPIRMLLTYILPAALPGGRKDSIMLENDNIRQLRCRSCLLSPHQKPWMCFFPTHGRETVQQRQRIEQGLA